MKRIKRFVAIFCAVCLSLFTLVTASAETMASRRDDLPSDAKIIYQDDDVLVYQSKIAKVNSTESGDDSYESVWLDAGETVNDGKLLIHNNIAGDVGVTWKTECQDENAYAEMYMTNPFGFIILNTAYVHPRDGDVWFRLDNGVVGTYTVHYMATAPKKYGMRIMCWMYK